MFEKIGMTAFGMAAMLLALGIYPRGQPYAPFIGLAGQPFWVHFCARLAEPELALYFIVAGWTLIYVVGCVRQVVRWRRA